jgi:threonine dehydrogenase-like Zn-dependent dehydrogenase
VELVDASSVDDVPAAILELTGGRGADRVVEAVGMEAHGSPLAEAAATAVTSLPRPVASKLMQTIGVDRMAALDTAFAAVRRGGTVSMVGVYGGAADPFNLMQLFDRQVTIRMGQANVRRWSDTLFDLLSQDDDVLGVESLPTHRLPLEMAPEAYKTFKNKEDGCIKVVLKP